MSSKCFSLIDNNHLNGYFLVETLNLCLPPIHPTRSTTQTVSKNFIKAKQTVLAVSQARSIFSWSFVSTSSRFSLSDLV